MKLPTKNDLYFLPLGGSNEIGMNLNLYGYNQQWLMVDLGISFHDRLGVEIMSPDTHYIETHKNHLKGLVITHAHEDHVGGVPYLWKRLECPIYTTPFTARILKQKLSEHSWGKDVPIFEVPLSGRVHIGDFEIEFVSLTHSIPEPNAVVIRTPLGKIFHTGDWKIDPHPMLGKATDVTRLKEIGKEGVLAMVCDSTNVFLEGQAGSEKGVKESLLKTVKKYPTKRVTISCFSSNVARIQTAIEIAKETGRSVCLVGRSLKKMVEAAQVTGYLKDLPEFLEEDALKRNEAHKTMIISTGSQGEPKAALSRIAGRQHHSIQFGPQDVVIFSSRIIPGNEKVIGALQNSLVLQGVDVVTEKDSDIHVSGHPSQEDLKKMYEWIKPQMLIPVHGEPRHLREHKRFALEAGIKQAIVPHNGSVIQLMGDEPLMIGEVHTGKLVLDGNRMVPMASPHLKDRHKLSCDGIIVVSLLLGKKGGSYRLKQPMHLTMYGLTISHEDTQETAKSISKTIHTVLEDMSGKNASEKIREAIKRKIKILFNKKPFVEVHVLHDPS